ncbi:LppX_LprAFG lipoprotein [Amycolatopsis anabasis]|uniref:LppX_LprAFG lipoprotein n=1 Tax=Amycolatopsis anabasis TaxID=1840409 RepID=UPI00131C154E|nr:LppX_LprAFG lipoprotein [Amycolatopsis anabasis]
MFCRRILPVVLLILGGLAGCTSSPDTSGPLPDGKGLVTAAAAAVDGLRSARFRFGVSGNIPGLEVREIEGRASRDGGPHGVAKGRADVQESTERFDVDYVLAGDTLYLTSGDGTRERRPVPAEFSPAAVLDPARGLRRLLLGVTGAKTEGREALDKVPAFRVTGKLGKDVISAVVPGIQADVDVKFWVSQAESRDLLRVWMQVPPQQPSEGAIMLELSLSELNVPVTVAPPF